MIIFFRLFETLDKQSFWYLMQKTIQEGLKGKIPQLWTYTFLNDVVNVGNWPKHGQLVRVTYCLLVP